EDLAGLLGLGHPEPASLGCFVWRPLAVVEIEEEDLVSQVGVAGDGAAATIFGVARMAAADDHLELAIRGAGSGWLQFRVRRLGGWLDQAGGSRSQRLAHQFASRDRERMHRRDLP